jgi:hypothetical protein
MSRRWIPTAALNAAALLAALTGIDPSPPTGPAPDRTPVAPAFCVDATGGGAPSLG